MLSLADVILGLGSETKGLGLADVILVGFFASSFLSTILADALVSSFLGTILAEVLVSSYTGCSGYVLICC